MSQTTRVFRASFVKEARTWLRNKERLGFVILFPLLYYSAFVLLMGGVYAGPGVETALVVEEQNPGIYTNGLIEILGEHDPIPPSLRLMEMDADAANRLFENGEILLVITIPNGFEQALQTNQSTSIHIRVNNAHEDMTKNLRMPIIRKLDIFYQTYLSDDASVVFNVELLNEYTPPRLAYMAWTVIVYGVSFGGMFLAASAVAQEYEQNTLEELALSNQSPFGIYAGKMLSGAALSYICVPAVLLLGWGLYGVLPKGDLFTFLMMTFPLAIFTAGLGVILGSLVRNSVYVVPICALVALFYWITGGGIAPLSLAGMGFAVLNEYVPFANAYRTMIEMFVQGTYSYVVIDMSILWILAILFLVLSPVVASRLEGIDFGARLNQARNRRRKQTTLA
ncbi:MAG: ABC transporter permease [Candidatus Thorarchaeota archaeon]|nr:ABC transporter permease [Candidatus Thorarchaeota archaeon]